MAARTEIQAGSGHVASLVLAGTDDGIVGFNLSESQYESAPGRKHFVALDGAGHLAFADICVVALEQGGLLQMAVDYGVDVDPILLDLGRDGCGEDYLDIETGWGVIEHATSAVFEEVLHCDDAMAERMAEVEELEGVAEHRHQP
jgi:hypothetical protein